MVMIPVTDPTNTEIQVGGNIVLPPPYQPEYTLPDPLQYTEQQNRIQQVQRRLLQGPPGPTLPGLEKLVHSVGVDDTQDIFNTADISIKSSDQTMMNVTSNQS